MTLEFPHQSNHPSHRRMSEFRFGFHQAKVYKVRNAAFVGRIGERHDVYVYSQTPDSHKAKYQMTNTHIKEAYLFSQLGPESVCNVLPLGFITEHEPSKLIGQNRFLPGTLGRIIGSGPCSPGPGYGTRIPRARGSVCG